MKKIIYVFIAGLSFASVQAQEVRDAVRYSQNNIMGTARYQAMSGAFGALGGDLSSLNVNPAGSSVFSNNQMALTFGNTTTNNASNYFGTNFNEKSDNFTMNQAGAVFVFKNGNRESKWKKFAIAINYENTNNFDNTSFSAGVNPTNSVGDYFLSFANANPLKQQDGIPLGLIKESTYYQLNYADQQAFLGYEGFLINPLEDTDNNNVYNSNVPSGGNYYQENAIIATGYNGKLAFNASADYNDRIHFGLNLNSHFTDFRQTTTFYEENGNNTANPVLLQNTLFENEIYTYGSGFSFQLGTIIKATKELRVGLAYESPTWYTLNDELRQDLSSETSDGFKAPDSNNFVVYDTYKLKTPSKFTGSLAYVFGKNGLISVDYSRKDYSKAEYSIERDTRDPYINTDIQQTLQASNEIRVGGEYKIKALSLRAGYRYEQSPYQDNSSIGDLKGYSAGIGYNFGSTKLDLAYANTKRDNQQGYFSQGFTDGANINVKTDTVLLSLVFEL
ncbi:OmpP1/FadL family transporter [Flavobacterium algicola]|uniref:OmpP1/FadL family transporter n=1 Tax=Flavobacterium algicola TaxID=556529 RepID=UPI001EFD3AC8|nr:outer membrane protein transport protein [Flavobacterium algicola]MCG9793350.1 outer membrane protein transport protein [Flavobacterium algicola]